MSTRFFLAAPLIAALVVIPRFLPGPVSDPSFSAGTSAAGAQNGRAAISGSVVDALLAPIAGVTVTLERGGRVVSTTKTDAAGAYRFVDVAPGDYRIAAAFAGYPSFARAFKVAAGATHIQFPIVLSRPEDLARTVTPESTGYATMIQAQSGQPAIGSQTASPAPILAPAVVGNASARVGGHDQNNVMIDGISGFGVTAQPYPYPIEKRHGEAGPNAGERYARIRSNTFQRALENPLSTFGADVDTASFANVRRFLMSGQLPPEEAVRVEELVNYFRIDYGAPASGQPMALTTEIGDAPWAPGHKLVLIGAKAAAPANRPIEGRNIVLLIDVSGSMASDDKLPLVKSALRMLVETLAPDDRLALVTYAGTSGIRLPSTPIRQRSTVLSAIDNLYAGGSTNGASGLVLAYRTAREAFVPGGVNRVILATDGDFNVGITSQHDLYRLIQREKESGVFLSVLGVGTGNIKDSTMEMLADRGNGHYSYLDSLAEARRVLVREADSTLEVVAKDVKFQVEFNPAQVAAWKLIGYENRVLAAEDFNDDRKDGGEMGANHTVTVLYEVVPVGVAIEEEQRRPAVDPLRYQSAPRPVVRAVETAARPQGGSADWLTVKVRYQAPEGGASRLIERAVRPGARSSDARYLPFASTVAEFGMLLRDSNASRARWDTLAARAASVAVPRTAAQGDREAFLELVDLARSLQRADTRRD